jgi:hypothetical protein
MTEPTGIRIADAYWLLDGRHYRWSMASLTEDCVTSDQRSLGIVMRGDGTVGVGIVAPRCAAAVSMTLTEAHELGRALLALEPHAEGSPFGVVTPE